MKCHQVLLKHQERRINALAEYKQTCSGFDDSALQCSFDFIKRRTALLSLELPYKISYRNPYPKDTSYMQETSYAERTTWNRIKEINPDKEPEDLQEIPFQRKAIEDIESLPHAPSSKKTLKSHVKSIVKGGKPKHYIHLAPKNIVDTEILASYFAYLEKRCLDSWNSQQYRDLLEVRLLFYTSLPVSQLDKICLKDIDFEGQMINQEDKNYPIPKSFIELAESILSPEEPIMQKNINQMNKFISQTSNSKKAEMNVRITPKIIQKSLPWIYKENGIAKDVQLRR